MGKGSRNRVAYAQEKAKKQEQRIKEQKKQKLNKRITLIVVAVVLIAAIAGTAFAITDSIKTKNRYDFHNTVNVSSDNYEITTAMMSYFFNLQYMTFQNNYYNNISEIDIDTSTSLKDQTCDVNFATEEDQTWFDYFYSLAQKQAEETLCLMEAAKQENFTLTEQDKATLAEAKKEMETAADEYDMDMQEYLDYVYGKGTKMEEIEKAMEYYQLSSSYYDSKYGDLTFTDDEINTYYNENKFDFNTVDYLAYSFSASLSSYGNDTTARNAAISMLRQKAETLTAATSAEDYKNRLEEYLKKTYNASATYTTTDIEEELKNCVFEGIIYAEDNEVCEWAFSDSVKAGDIKVFEEETDGVYYVSVVYMTKPMYRDETVTRDIRHILLTKDKHGSADAAKAKAQEILDKYKAGEKTEESFAKLATEYTEDPGSKTTGGLYKSVTQGQMVETFNNWMFDAERKAGDTGIVESTHGSHIMYYPGVEMPAWKTSVNNKLIMDKFDAAIIELGEKHNVKSQKQNIALEELDY